MTPDVALSVKQFIGAWKLMCCNEPHYANHAMPGLEMVFGGLASPFFNVGFTTGEIPSAEALGDWAQAAKTWADLRQVPWFFAITQDLLAEGIDAHAVLGECGLTLAMQLTGMHAQDVTPLPASPDGLELKVPQDDPSCREIMEINGAAYEMDLASLGSQLACSASWLQHFPVVGVAAGEPASSAAVLMVDGLRYVALVATAPRHQRKGYASAAMRYALTLSAAQHGAVPTILHATEAGKPVYQRMGYRSIATHMLYIDTRFVHA